jgi:hypothetical protein
MKDLNFKFDNNGSYEDYTPESRDYLRDNFSVSFVSGEDAFYIGLYKPFEGVYMELLTASGFDVQASFSYYKTNSFQSLKVSDDTNGLQRSGFIKWNREVEGWSKTTIDGDERYWIRIEAAQDFSLDIQGCNIVFADDQDLLSEVRDILDYRYSGDFSFIAYHVASRNEIVQSLRNGGYKKYEEIDQVTNVTQKYMNITKWDILELGEVRQAAKYLALSKIMFDVSENVDDKQFQAYSEFKAMYGAAFDLFYLSLDKDDDGEIDDETERLQDNNIEIYKL